MSDDKSTITAGAKNIQCLTGGAQAMTKLNMILRRQGSTYKLAPLDDITALECVFLNMMLVAAGAPRRWLNYDWWESIKDYGIERHFKID